MTTPPHTTTPEMLEVRRLCEQCRWDDAEAAAQGDPRLLVFVAMCREVAVGFGTRLFTLSMNLDSAALHTKA